MDRGGTEAGMEGMKGETTLSRYHSGIIFQIPPPKSEGEVRCHKYPPLFIRGGRVWREIEEGRKLGIEGGEEESCAKPVAFGHCSLLPLNTCSTQADQPYKPVSTERGWGGVEGDGKGVKREREGWLGGDKGAQMLEINHKPFNNERGM